MYLNIYSNIIYVTNPGSGNDIKPNIENAITSANAFGDTIILPQGTFIFNGTITTNKRFILKGEFLVNWPSSPQTILKRSELISDSSLALLPMITFNTNLTTSSGIIVSDIEFRSKIPSIYPGDGNSLAEDVGIKFIKSVDFSVTRCSFKYFGAGAIRVIHWDNIANGLIYNCKFERNAKGVEGLGLGYGIVVSGEDLNWQTDEQWGSSNFVFIEDCNFDYHRHSVASSGCGKYVIRYSNISNNDISISSVNHSIDAHAARGGTIGSGNYHSTYAIEAYNNTINHTNFWSNTGINDPIISGENPNRLIKYGLISRGGGGLYHNNTINGTRFAIGLYIDEFPFGESIPIKYALGYQTSRLYMWDNNFTPYVNGTDWAGLPLSGMFQNIDNGIYNSSSGLYEANKEFFIENIDYFFTSKPGYVPYTYPHPRRDDLEILNNTITKTDTKFKIYPNPVKKDFKLVISKDELPAVLKIINLNGELKLTENLKIPENNISISEFSAGIYMILIETPNSINCEKLIKE